MREHCFPALPSIGDFKPSRTRPLFKDAHFAATIPLVRSEKSSTGPETSRLLYGRRKISSYSAESWVLLHVKSQTVAVQDLAVEDHRLDFPRIADSLRGIPSDDHHVCLPPRLQASPFLLRVHDSCGIEGRRPNGLQRRHSRIHQQFQFVMQRFTLEN